MAFEQRPNSGSMFKNSRRNNANSPDYLGKANINGQDVEISAWVKTASPTSKIAGEKYVTLLFRIPEQSDNDIPGGGSSNRPNTTRSAPADYDDFDDDIPF